MTIDWTLPVETTEDPPRPVRVLFDKDNNPSACFIDNELHSIRTNFTPITAVKKTSAGCIMVALRNVAPPKPEPILRTAWVNLYPDGGACASQTRDAANAAQKQDGTRVECRRIAWMSDGSPVPGEEIPAAAWKENSDHWKAKAEAIQAEVERQRAAHEDKISRMMEQVNGEKYYRKQAEADLAAAQAALRDYAFWSFDEFTQHVATVKAARDALRVMQERVEKADEFLMDDGHGEGSRVRECLADAIEAARGNQ